MPDPGFVKPPRGAKKALALLEKRIAATPELAEVSLMSTILSEHCGGRSTVLTCVSEDEEGDRLFDFDGYVEDLFGKHRAALEEGGGLDSFIPADELVERLGRALMGERGHQAWIASREAAKLARGLRRAPSAPALPRL